MSKLSLKMKLGLGFGTVLAILLVLGVATYIGLANIQAQARVVADNVEKKELTEAINAGLEKQLVGARGFLITKNDAQLQRYREGNELLANSADKLEKLLVTDEGKKALADIRDFERQLHAQQERAIELRRADREKDAKEALFSAQNDQLRAAMRRQVETLIGLEEKLKQEAQDQQAATQRQSLRAARPAPVPHSRPGLSSGGHLPARQQAAAAGGSLRPPHAGAEGEHSPRVYGSAHPSRRRSRRDGQAPQ